MLQNSISLGAELFCRLQELENYILDMRRQLQEASEERATLLQVQRQQKTDMALLTEDRDGAKDTAARTARELALSNAKLKVYPQPACPSLIMCSLIVYDSAGAHDSTDALFEDKMYTSSPSWTPQ